MRLYYGSIITGILLIGIGLLIWLSNLHIVHIYWKHDWPAILIAVGVIELIRLLVKR